MTSVTTVLPSTLFFSDPAPRHFTIDTVYSYPNGSFACEGGYLSDCEAAHTTLRPTFIKLDFRDVCLACESVRWGASMTFTMKLSQIKPGLRQNGRSMRMIH